MMARWTEVASRAGGFTSDSRNFRAGDVFVALKGGQVDGHDHVTEILMRSPTAVIVRAGWGEASGISHPALIEVADTPLAHRELASAFRRKFKGRVIAVGGSSGKTSAKEFIATLLAAKFRVVKTQKSQNGELGIPKTLEQLRDGVEVAVVEVGIDAPGDMIRHASLVEPDYAFLTSIGEEHLNLLKTVENVFHEEKVLFDVTLARRGICFASGSDPWLRKLAGTNGVVLVPADPTLFSASVAAKLHRNLPNAYAIQNATLAIYIAREMGMKESEIFAAIDQLQLPEGRGNILHLKNDVVLIADHYNSNPSSLKAGLQAASSRSRIEKKSLVLILGDMLDLGDMSHVLHQDMVKDIRGSGAIQIFTVGPEMTRLVPDLLSPTVSLVSYEDSTLAAEAIKKLNLKSVVVLLKGSRGMALEKVLNVLT